jgi:hypothetical protein
MPKLRESQIDLLIKRISACNADEYIFHQLIGWFKTDALTEGQGHQQTKRRAHGAAFFGAIERILEDDSRVQNP